MNARVQNGCIFNRMDERAAQPKPEVGMGATILMYSDRHAATVVGVSANGKVVRVQQDKATRTDTLGVTDSGQRYRYERNKLGKVRTFSLRSNGCWVEAGAQARNGTTLKLGVRDEHYDPSF